ncbi:O-antigen ligase family protein [Pontibacter anaerobius]|uniref:O-antigen ligase family protein n=1 Tax=Pontibacter anaerobius TaxID=2993940 RepID=A0ABT3REZ9_9BACT|nr:O-antigen ligase family protein [Pontibacter anaerobius]MCX2739942.1 O-antigen ligase family protein [Pontibacter anaerobius]
MKRHREWGYILTLFSIGSVFLGSSVIGLDLSFFKLYPLRLFGFIGLVFMVISKGWKDAFLSFNSRFVLFFLGLGFISIMWSPDTVLAIKEFGIIQTGLTLSWLIFRYIDSEDRVKVLLNIWVVGALFVNLIGLWEVWQQEYLIVTEVGEMTERAIMRMGFLAPRSVFGNQNNFAFFNSLTSLVLLGVVMKKYQPTKLYILTWASLVLSLFILISSYSRAAIGAFVLGTFAFLLLTMFSSNTHKASVTKLLLVGVVGFIILVFVDSSILTSLADMLYLVVEKHEYSSQEGRAFLYAKSMDYAVDNAGIGMGPGASVVNLAGWPPHNYLIQILVEYGILILLVQLWVVFKAYRRFGLYKSTVNSALPTMGKAVILAFPLMSIGPSTILGEGVFWLWFGFTIAFSSIIARKYYRAHFQAT